MNGSNERRRLERLPLTCGVVVREKLATWVAETADLGLRGCRLHLERPLARGTLIQLAFESGDGAPLETLGQVVWTKGGDTREAGIKFVPMLAGAGPQAMAGFIDAVVAAQLRAVAALGRAAGRLGAIPLQLGTPPVTALSADELAVVRAARRGDAIAAVAIAPEAIATLAALLARGVISVARRTPDPEGWKTAIATSVARTPEPAVDSNEPILLALPEERWREEAVTILVDDYLANGTFAT